MRGPFIWAPINIGEWSHVTKRLTQEEKGCLMDLLLSYWENGEFIDERSIPRELGISHIRWVGMQGPVGDALRKYLDRSRFIEERVKAAKISHERKRAANNRWDRERKNATQGLDANAYANADPIGMPTTSTEEETYTDRVEKLTRDKGLGEKSSWAETVTPLRPNGKLRH